MLEGRTTAAVFIGGVEKPLIRADLAASDALQGSGIIRHRGSCEVAAIVNPQPGAVVTFQYTKGGATTTLPYKMRVLSHFANPITGITSIELGCKLTYLSERKPAIEDPSTADENGGIPCEVFRTGTLSLSASYVFNQCLTALGITASSNPLTNKFAIWEFDLSGGYVQAMSDLLVSECYVGELDFDEVLQVRSLEDETATGPSLQKADVIEMGPIGTGRLPGDAVVVRYSKRTLRTPDDALSDEEKAIQNWEYSKTESFSDQAVVLKEGIDWNGFAAEIKYFPYSITETYTYYDVLDRVVRREEYTRRPFAEVNSRLFSDAYLPTSRTLPEAPTFAITGGGESDGRDQYAFQCIYRDSNFTPDPPDPGWEDLPDEWYGNQCQKSIQTLTVTTTEYVFPAPEVAEEPGDTVADCEADRDAAALEGEDRSKVAITRTLRYESETQVMAAIQFTDYSDQWRLWYDSAGLEGFNVFATGITPNVLVEQTDTYYDPVQASLRLAEYGALSRSPNELTFTEKTQSTTFRWLIYLYSVQGQQLSALRALDLIQGNITQGSFSSYYQAALYRYMPGWDSLVPQETTQEIVIGREYGLQERPSAAERSNLANTVPEPTEQKSELAWVYGAVSSQDVVEFTLPLAPDDALSWSEGGGWVSTPSDAQDKAIRYGRVQNRMLLGNRQGAELQVLPEKLPPMAFDSIYLTVDGLTVQYRLNNATWVLTAGEVVAGANAMFWGVVGGTSGYDVADAWVPLAPGTVSLPETPAGTPDPTYGEVLAPSGIEVPYTETVAYSVYATRGAFALTGLSAGGRATQSYGLFAAGRDYTVTGYEKHPIEYGNTVTVGSFTTTIADVSGGIAVSTTLAAGSFAVTGNSVLLTEGVVFEAASFALTGNDVVLVPDTSIVNAEVGSLALIGNDASFAINAYTPESLSPTGWWDVSNASTVTLYPSTNDFNTLESVLDPDLYFRSLNTTAPPEPLYVADGLNGLPVCSFVPDTVGGYACTFDGYNTISTTMKLGDLFSSTGFSLCMVMKLTSTSTDSSTAHFNSGWFAPVPFTTTYGRSSGVLGFILYNGSTRYPVGVSYTLDTWVIFSAQWNGVGTGVEVRLDGGSASTSSAFTGTLSGLTSNMTLGESSSQEWSMAEMVTCNTYLAESDRQELEGYMAHKWGLAANLPGGHPYKSAPP